MLEGIDFGKIIMMLDYYIRTIMSLLDGLLGMTGSKSEADTGVAE